MAPSIGIPLVSQPTQTACFGKFENASQIDIFQVLNGSGSVQMHMNANGSIDPPIYPQNTVKLITSAQLLNLNTTPVILVPSPGPNVAIVPISAVVVYYAGTTPYTITGADAGLYIGWDQPPSANNTQIFLSDTPFFDQSTSQIQIGSGQSNTPQVLTNALGASLKLGIVDVLSLGNGSAGVLISYNVVQIIS